MDGGMWGTVVGGVLGFIASVMPRLFEILDAYFNHKHAQEAQAQQIDAATKGVVVVSTSDSKVAVPAEGEVLAPGIPADVNPALDTLSVDDAFLEPPVVPTFWTRVFDVIRYSVRPLITYGFFGLFLFVKLKGMHHAFYVDHTPAIQLLPVVWDEGAESMFAAVLAFWFGSRAFEKSKALTGKGPL